jgi:CubicO group peptidase (beta-lactamase class C family)
MKRREALAGLATAAMLSRHTGASGTPQSRRAPAEILEQFASDEHPDLKGVVVRIDGIRVAERYFNGDHADTLHDIRSAGKSITSLLVGAALDRRLIRNLTDPVRAYLPEMAGSAIGDVALADVLTMRSGLAADDDIPESPGNEDLLDEAVDPVAFLRAVPRATPPGSTYVYNSLTAYAAGLVVERAARQRGADFARATLFAPLGIDRFEWASDIAGHTKGQGNLSVTARDLATIGQMILDRGRHAGRQVIDADWIAASLRPRVTISASDPYADGYGYFWYTKAWKIGGADLTVHFASGNGGNKIYVVPALRMAVGITSSAYGRGYGQRRSQAILAALLGA